MNYEEFVLHDKNKVFNDFISIEEAFKIGVLNNRLYDAVPRVCGDGDPDKGCGSDFIITFNAKTVMCCNPRCWRKVGYTLLTFLKNYEIKEVGEGSCLTIARHFYEKAENKLAVSHLQVYKLPHHSMIALLGVSKASSLKYGLEKIQNTKQTFPQFVSNLGIPELKETAFKIFSKISNSSQFLEELDKYGLQYFLSQKGVHDPKVAYYIREFIEEIIYAESKIFLNIPQVPKQRVPVVITGDLVLNGVTITQKGFCDYCTDMFTLPGGTRLVEIYESSATASVDYFIIDYVEGSRITTKHSTALRREKTEGRKLIYTSNEFVGMLEGVLEGVNYDV